MEAKKEVLTNEVVDDQKTVLEQLQVLKGLQRRLGPYEGCLVFENNNKKLHALNEFLPVCNRVIANLKGELKSAQKDLLMAAYHLKSQIHCNKAYLLEIAGDEEYEKEYDKAEDVNYRQMELIKTTPTATKELQKLRINDSWFEYRKGYYSRAIHVVRVITDEVEKPGEFKRAFEAYGKEVCLEAFIYKVASLISSLESVDEVPGILKILDAVYGVYFCEDYELCARFTGRVLFGNLFHVLTASIEKEESKALVSASNQLIKVLEKFKKKQLEKLEDKFWENLEKACTHYTADKEALAHAYVLLAGHYCDKKDFEKTREFYGKYRLCACELSINSIDSLGNIYRNLFSMYDTPEEMEQMKPDGKIIKKSIPRSSVYERYFEALYYAQLGFKISDTLEKVKILQKSRDLFNENIRCIEEGFLKSYRDDLISHYIFLGSVHEALIELPEAISNLRNAIRHAAIADYTVESFAGYYLPLNIYHHSEEARQLYAWAVKVFSKSPAADDEKNTNDPGNYWRDFEKICATIKSKLPIVKQEDRDYLEDAFCILEIIQKNYERENFPNKVFQQQLSYRFDRFLMKKAEIEEAFNPSLFATAMHQAQVSMLLEARKQAQELPTQVSQLQSEVIELRAEVARLKKGENKREVEVDKMHDSSSQSLSERGKRKRGESGQSDFFDPKRNKNASTDKSVKGGDLRWIPPGLASSRSDYFE